jgi:hypothetical protein
MDNVVVELQVLLVDIVIVDEMMVVVNVVLIQTKRKTFSFISIEFLNVYVVDIEMDFELIQAYYNVQVVLA